MKDRVRLGISACLLGRSVRYDGGHRLDPVLKEAMEPFVEWLPLCPEVEYGLPVPREALCLVGDPESPRLVTVDSGIDHTERMLLWAEERLNRLEQENLCGFIFKSGSPSSGLRGIKVYSASGVPSLTGIGLFARSFIRRFPDTPVEDDALLQDPIRRGEFIESVLMFGTEKASRSKPS